MKRKIFRVLFALVLVLSLGLITAVPAAAAGTLNVVPYTLYTDGNGTSVWSTAQAKTGSSSVLLTHTDNTGSVYVDFVPPAGETLGTFQTDITGGTPAWSFWHWLQNTGVTNGPQFELRFEDSPGDGWLEVTAVGLQGTTGTEGWLEETLAGATLAGFGGNTPDGSSVFEWGTLTALSGIQTAVNAAWEAAETTKVATDYQLKRVRVELWEDIDQYCYIDDIQIAGVTYYDLIQDAIDTAIADDTITVAAGTYAEEITVDKNLTITCTATCTITGDVHFDASSITMTDATLDTGYEWYVDSDTASIQDAIDAATASDTINVAAGTYVEDITVGTATLTLKSVAGRDTTTIQGTLLLNGSADNFVLGGTTGKGFTIEGTDPLICLMTGADTVEISHNACDTTTGSFSRAITTNPGNVTGLTVSNNTFTLTDAADQAVRSSVTDTITGWTISDNDFTGTYPTKADQSAIEIPELDISSLDTVISGNTFTTVNNGVLIGASSGGGLISSGTPAALTITGNTFTGCKFGIDLTNASSADHVHDVRIKQNTFTNNTEGLAINHGDYPNGTDLWQPEDFTVKYNQFSGNTHGIYNNADVKDPDLTAEYNYWGRATGAYHATTNPGVSGYRGDAVSDDVDYDPWLYYTTATNLGDTLANIVANQVPAYAFSRPLLAGWNTFSAPIGLDGQYNNWNELVALTSLPYTMAYRFNPTSQTFESLATTDTDAIAPGEGFYIKMDSAGSIPYCSSTLFSMPSRALEADWNFIGGGMTAQAASDVCVSIATTGSTAGYSHLISPAENASSWIWIYDTTGTTDDFVVGEGYWAFLVVDRTLGLFDPTPLGWVP